MGVRWGLGPVFASEWLAMSRRWQVYGGRVLFVGVLLLALTSVFGASIGVGEASLTIQDLAIIGQSFYNAIVFSQLTLVLLAAPAATAGVICQEKLRGNLALLLITGLSDAEIVLGKLAGRLVPVLGLICCTLPVLALCLILGGIEPLAMAGTFAITVSLAVLTCSIALAFSLWGTKPHEVLLATFAVLTIWLLAVPVWEFFTWIWSWPGVPRWALWSNPYILALRAGRSGLVGVVQFAGFTASCLIVSGILLGVSIRRLRPVFLAQAEGSAGRRRARRGGLLAGWDVPGDGNPVFWYERHRKRSTPWIRGILALYATLAVGFSGLAIFDALFGSRSYQGQLPSQVNAFQFVMGVPLLLLSASTALVEERARGSLDVLLTTPIASSQIVLAKWWCVFRFVPLLIALPMLVALAMVWEGGSWGSLFRFALYLLAACAAWTSVGLAISTWIPQLGRAVALVVCLFAVAGLGWPMMALTLWGDQNPIGQGLTMISPFYGGYYLTDRLWKYGIRETETMTWCAFWTGANALVALGLLVATLATFDRILGRMPEGLRGLPEMPGIAVSEPPSTPTPAGAGRASRRRPRR